jgi:hypothetical protein
LFYRLAATTTCGEQDTAAAAQDFKSQLNSVVANV